RETPGGLSRALGKSGPATFVIIGPLRRALTEEEAERLLSWVDGGGRLVVIDREPATELLPIVNDLRVAAQPSEEQPAPDLRADNLNALASGVSSVKPAQPTLLTNSVEQIMPSRFASRLYVHILNEAERKAEAERQNKKSAKGGIVFPTDVDDMGDEPPPKPTPTADAQEQPSQLAPAAVPSPASSHPTPERGGIGPSNEQTDVGTAVEELEGEMSETENASGKTANGTKADEEIAEGNEVMMPLAPVLHFTDERGALVADFRYGLGRIVVLSEPFIVANNGIRRADNLQLAVNLLTNGASQTEAGLLAFDEYHQGRGETHNQLLAYFAGTPVLAACGQLALIALVVIWSRGQRFARPLPAPHVDRRSKLEFVVSMAELQQRARAYDLAIENVYGRTHRALARYGGTDNNVPRTVIAERIAARAGIDRDEIERLMRACEDAINGAPISAKESLRLIARLRELERTLGITMRAREIKQAKTL
ncbi:MAG: DUF4350 domain-containing protein, partial [Pyrinomonadaceae bacterium]